MIYRFYNAVGTFNRQKWRFQARKFSALVDSATLRKGSVVLLGIPSDENSSFMKGSAKSPPLIRQALQSPSSNGWSENPSLDILKDPKFVDGGDISTLSDNKEEAFEQISDRVRAFLLRDARVISLGGDHSITYPIVAGAYAKHYNESNPLTILQFDAHPHLYENLDGNEFSHATPFARIMEEKAVSRLIQIGVRTMNDHQREQANRFGVEVLTMDDLDERAPEAIKTAIKTIRGPLYISVDLDALDPAYAPGVSHHEPGGLSTRQIINFIHSIRTPVVGADIVEYNPDRDINDVTSMVAAKLLKEIAAKMLAS